MRVSDVERQMAYWAEYPSNGELLRIVARALGWKPPTPEVDQIPYEEAAAQDADWFENPARFFPGSK